MKYIKKGNEPATLKEYRETTPEATYEGFVDTDNLLKKSLLNEQGYICAYCMQRISLKRSLGKPRIEVEHFLPQKYNTDKPLDYDNMLAVCNGNQGGNEHCDKSKKDKELNKLNPLYTECESLITYSLGGEIKSISGKADVNNDINNILNLNNQNLIDMRKSTVDLILEKLKKDFPTGRWKKSMFEKMIQKYSEKNEKGMYIQFYSYVVWYLHFLKNRPKYN